MLGRGALRKWRVFHVPTLVPTFLLQLEVWMHWPKNSLSPASCMGCAAPRILALVATALSSSTG